MRKSKTLASVGLFFLFFLFFLICYIIALQMFSIDASTNTLLVPSWYPIVGIAISIGGSILSQKIIARVGTQKYSDEFSIAVNTVINFGSASPSLLQRKMKIGFARASIYIDEMEALGIVGKFNGSKPRNVLMSKPEWKLHRQELLDRRELLLHKGSSASENTIETTLRRVDCMDGHSFERWCADLLKLNGFENVSVTPGSGDQGVDILAEKDEVKYAIQCKCYSNDLGNSPVQEIHTGRTVYKCQIGIVMTNQGFTDGAKKAAEATGVLLWGREKLIALIESAGMVE